MDVHSREKKYVAKATALGASVSFTRHFLIHCPKMSLHCTIYAGVSHFQDPKNMI